MTPHSDSQELSRTRTTYRARWLFDGCGRVIDGGRVTVAEGRILSVGDEADSTNEVDLGSVALLPGLVNAHTHLEFSAIREPLGRSGMPLPDWITQIVSHRQASSVPVAAAVADGIQQAVHAGTVAIGEIATPGWSPEPFATSPIACTVFFEVIGLLRNQHDECLTRLDADLRWAAQQDRWPAGISPHAPYSVHQRLLQALVDIAVQRGLPMAMHLAESREELQLLKDGNGPFRDRLMALGAWDETAISRGTRTIDYLRVLAPARRTMVIHGNYLEDDEIEFLTRYRDRMTVVYCPRTHAYFEHPPHPLSKLLDAGVPVALGTDGRGSSPTLSLLDELRFAAAQHSDVPREQLLRSATLTGARALGLEAEIGTIEPGKRADFAIVGLEESDRRGPYTALLDSDQPTLATISGGRTIFSDERLPLA